MLTSPLALTYDALGYALLIALALLSLGYLAAQLVSSIRVAWIRSSIRDSSPDMPAPMTASDDVQEVPEVSTAGPAGAHAAPSEPPQPQEADGADGATAGNEPALRPRPQSERARRLQRLLNEGVALQQRSPTAFGLRLGVAPQTTLADVNAWEARVEAELVQQHRERDIGLFYYEPPTSPLGAISLGIREDPVRKRLNRRVRQLETLVRKTP